MLKLFVIKILFFGHVVSLQRGSTNATVIQLRGEIKQLLKEASSLSQWVFLEVYEKSFFNLTVEIHHITVCCQCHGHLELNCSDVYSFLFDMISFCLVSCFFWKNLSIYSFLLGYIYCFQIDSFNECVLNMNTIWFASLLIAGHPHLHKLRNLGG